jgi:hypothetical protein
VRADRLPDPAAFDRIVLVGMDQLPRHHGNKTKPRHPGGDLVDQAGADLVEIRIFAKDIERQDREQRLARLCRLLGRTMRCRHPFTRQLSVSDLLVQRLGLGIGFDVQFLPQQFLACLILS